MPKANVFIATPTYTGDVCADYATCLCLAGMHCILRDIWLQPHTAPGFSLVEYARNYLVAKFLESNCTHLFWIDSDLFFDPDSIARFINHGKDVVAGVYTTKHPDNPVYPFTSLGPCRNGLFPAERVPGGFICMSRAAVEKVIAEQCEWHEFEHNGEKIRAPRFFNLYLDKVDLVGEDYVASARLRKAGFTVNVDPNVRFLHYGRKAWAAQLSALLDEDKNQNSKEAWEKNKLKADQTLEWELNKK